MYLSELIYLRLAFDTVWHEGLLYKLKENTICRKLFTVIKDMHSCCQSSIKIDNMYSDFFFN
jgi:hypothetical protein